METSTLRAATAATNTSPSDTIHVGTKPAVVTWQSSDGTWTLLRTSKLEAAYDAAQETAYLKLSMPITVQQLPPKRRVGLPIFVDPERVLSMRLDEDMATPGHPEVQAALGATAWRLHIRLARPADLIGPRMDLTPCGKTSAEAMSGLRALAQQTQFDILFSHRAATKANLARLCDVFGKCMRDPREPNMARLYHGKGGIVLDATAALAPPETEDCPPAYDDSAPVPPYHVSRSEKRKRDDDGGQLSSLDVPTQARVEAVWRKMFEESRAALKAELQAELRAELQDYAAHAVEERTLSMMTRQKLEGDFQRMRDETMAAVQEELGRPGRLAHEPSRRVKERE